MLPFSIYGLQGHLSLNIQLADGGGEKRWNVGGLCEPQLEVEHTRNSRNSSRHSELSLLRNVISHKKEKKKNVLIVQLSLSNYFLKLIYKLEDSCHKGHNLFLWLFESLCWINSRRSGSVTCGARAVWACLIPKESWQTAFLI